MDDSGENPKVSVILPALDEAAGLRGLLPRLQQVMQAHAWELILVDDGSQDETARVGREHGARVLRHPYRKGNGAAVKRGIRAARGEIIVLLDADGQHRPEDIPALLGALEPVDGAGADMAVGARTRGSGQKPHRWAANRLFSWLASYLAGERIADLTSGFRALRAELASRYVDLLPNTFSYPSTLTVTLARSGYSVVHVPLVTEQRQGRSKIRPLSDGLRFLFILLKVGVGLTPFRVFFPVSLAFFGAGLGWYLHTYFSYHRFTNMSALLLCTSVIIFMLGLVAEQIASLRRERGRQ